MFRCPFVLFQAHCPLFLGGSGIHEDWGLMFFRGRHFRYGLTDADFHQTRTWVQQLTSFTMHTGLAEQSRTYLLRFSAFSACCFPLCVSAPGRLNALEVFTPFLPRVAREFPVRRHGAPSQIGLALLAWFRSVGRAHDRQLRAAAAAHTLSKY